MALNPVAALEDIIGLSFARILTSGGQPMAVKGLSLISELSLIAGDRIVVMPGGGVTPENLDEILKVLPNLQEFHGSGSGGWQDSRMKHRNKSLRMGLSPDYAYKETDAQIVSQLVDISQRLQNNS